MVNLGWLRGSRHSLETVKVLEQPLDQAARSRMTTTCTGDGLASFRAIGRVLGLVMLLADLAAGGEVLLPLR